MEKYFIAVIFAVLWKIAANQENNVCPSYMDYFSVKTNPKCWYNFAADSKVPDIIEKTGYPFKEYKVQTQDGYILTVFRIPRAGSEKPPVFMLHGVQGTAAIFVGLGNASLAFLLWNEGYDVWLGNYRGTEYSHEHVALNPTMKEFWNYGADDIALKDVPAMINLIRNETKLENNVASTEKNNRKIVYIGHSLGTTAALMYAAEYPEHSKENVQLFMLMSPSYKLTHAKTPYRLFFPFVPIVLPIANSANLVQTISSSNSSRISRAVCLSSPMTMLLCLNTLDLFLGPFTDIAPETIPVFFNQIPGGTSLKTLSQLRDSLMGRFSKFNYGKDKNVEVYGTPDAPQYNISKIQVPFFLFYARNDWITTPEDAKELYEALPKSARFGSYEVTKFYFNHYDFLFGKSAKSLVYPKVLQVLDALEK